MRLAALLLVACARPPVRQLANHASGPDEVHLVVAPALGFTGEVDEPVQWRLERSGAQATLLITKRDHDVLRYTGPVHEQGNKLHYELADGGDRIALLCERGPVRVHPAGSHPLPRPDPARCSEPPRWEPRDELTIQALSCTFEPASPSRARTRLLTFAPPPGFDAVEDQCCAGDSCEVRWDVRMR